ncbi:MAG: hypothetical protein WCR21_08720 [Bacteroidota bacterium]
MNKKTLSFTFALLAIGNIFAQSLQYRNFDFKEKTPVNTCSAQELKSNKAVVLDEIKAKEIIVNPNDDIENYLFYYRAIAINDISIIDKFNKIYIPVANSSELLTLKCRIIKENGSTIELFKGDMKSINEDGENYNILALEGLEKNAIIEYFYLKRVSVSYYTSEYVNSKYLVKNYQLQIISPRYLEYDSKTYNGMSTAKDSSDESKNFKVFELKNIQPTPEEKYTSSYEKYPHAEIKLSVNTNNRSKKLYTFSDFSKQAIKNYHTLEKDDAKTVQKINKKLNLEKLSSTDEKVFAIEAYIKNDIGSMESSGDLTMTECLEKKGLTKFYQNKLTSLLLDKCQINYELVATSDRNDKIFDSEFESYSFLTEILFYIPETKKYFSYENILYRYGLTPPSVNDQKALFIKPFLIGDAYSATNSIKRIETVDVSSSYDNLDLDISFDPAKNKLTQNITRSMQGFPAAGSRAYYYYNTGAKREEFIKELLNLGLENTKVSLPTAQNFELNEFKKYNLPFICSGIVETTNMTETAGNNFIFKIGNCIGPQSELYQEEKRHYQIYALYAHGYKRKIVFEVPSGYTVQGLEKLNIKNELKSGDQITAFFKSNYTQTGNKITVMVEESYNNAYFAVDQFEGFRKIINTAADFNKITLLLKKQ